MGDAETMKILFRSLKTEWKAIQTKARMFESFPAAI